MGYAYVKPGGTLYNGLYGEAPPERGTFFRLQVMTGYGIHELKYMKGQENLSNKQLKRTFIQMFRKDAPLFYMAIPLTGRLSFLIYSY